MEHHGEIRLTCRHHPQQILRQGKIALLRRQQAQLTPHPRKIGRLEYPPEPIERRLGRQDGGVFAIAQHQAT